ncbi:MAG: glutamyl-tRNA reductase [Actinomycetia bacterium]|nr:glutamyl-tRNA reductase [Actinomycetes bacterium]
MHLALVGLSHKTAPVDIREKVTFPADVLPDALTGLAACAGVLESLIISTCNRTEFYAVTTDEADGPAVLAAFMATYHGLTADMLAPYLYIHTGEDVVRHLFRVAASLDSMVLGEAQILGQLKDAYDAAFEAGTTSRIFNEMFRHSFTAGKRVRSETAIGSAPVSISYAAVELAKQVFESLEGRRALVLGAGKMSELTATHLEANGVAQLFVANRTFERAEQLAAQFEHGQAVPFEQRYEHLRDVDIVVSATAAEDYVLTAAELEPYAKRRRDPLFLIDIAVPRDIDPACGDFRQVYAYDVDALNGIVDANLEQRQREAAAAEAIVAEEMESFETWLESMEVVPTIAEMREQAEAIRTAELARACKRLSGELSMADLKVIEKLTESITNKMLHEPTSQLRAAGGGRRGVAVLETTRYLYGLDRRGAGAGESAGAGEGAASQNSGFRLIRSLLGRRATSATQQIDPLELGE